MGGKLKAKKKSPGARSKSSGSTTSKASAAATAASDPAVRVPSDVKPNNTAEDTMQTVFELREQGNQLFTQGEVENALQCYTAALGLTPERHPDRALLHSNRAACFVVAHKFDEVIIETTKALEYNPYFPRALQRRARAYEALGLLRKAHADVSLLLKVMPGNEEAKLEEQRLAAGIAAAMAAKPGERKKAAAAALESASKRKEGTMIKIKCSLGSDVRTVEVSSAAGYDGVMAAVRAKYHETRSPLALKYRDLDGNAVTVTSQADLRAAMRVATAKQVAEAAADRERSEREGGGHGPSLPKPPTDTPKMVLELVPVSVTPRSTDPGQDQVVEEVEFDDWMLDFADLFRQQLGVDADSHISLYNEGVELWSQALEEVATSEEAQPLLDRAASRFQEAAAMALFNWGNVHTCASRKRVENKMDEAKKEGGDKEDGSGEGDTVDPVSFLTREEAVAQDDTMQLAAAKYEEVLAVKDDFYEAVIALGQHRFDRAKLFMGNEHAARHAEELWAAQGNKLSSDQIVDQLFEEAVQYYKDALEMLPVVSQRNKEAAEEAAARGKEVNPDPVVDVEAEATPQVLLMWGNVLYEQSALKVKRQLTDMDWKSELVQAVKKFRAAACNDQDIYAAVVKHPAGKDDALAALRAEDIEFKEEESPAAEGEAASQAESG